MADHGSQSLRQTPLHAEHARLGARFAPFAGWDMPLNYADGQVAEHMATRQRVGIFDVSHMGQVRLRGPRAIDFLAWLVPGNVRRLADGESLYTTLCNERGGVQDDLIVSRLSQHEWFAVINAGNAAADIAWMRARAAEWGFPGTIADECDAWAMIAVQGPEALALVASLFPEAPIKGSRPFTIFSASYNGSPAIVSRTGYTGEDGAEVLVAPGEAAALWHALLDAGAAPCGLAARDSLRLEMGYPLHGNDLDASTTPLEGGIGWTVSVKKPDDFIGRAALEAMKAAGAPRVRVGVKVEGRRPLRHGDEVALDGRVVGVVTSGGFSPVLNAGIGLALVEASAAGALAFDIVRAGRAFPVVAAPLPFVTPGSKKQPRADPNGPQSCNDEVS